MQECPANLCRRHGSRAKLSRLLRLAVGFGLAIAAPSCRGYDTIPLEEAQWQRVGPELVGMSATELWRCAGPPLTERATPSGTLTMTYRASDLENYCEVRLMLEGGRVRAFAVEHDAPEFLWLLDGSNYCGRIFAGCIR